MKKNHYHIIGIITLFAFCFAPATALSQKKSKKSAHSVQEKKEKEAMERYKQAQVYYNLGRFQEAAVEYEKAYEISQLPGFLFNIGQCQRELKNYDRAVFFFQGYLREKPDTKNRKLVENLIVESEKQIKAQKEKAKRKEEEKKQKLAADFYKDSKGKKADSNLRSESDAPIYQKWWFWTIVGSAVVVATGGVVLAMSSDDKSTMPSGSLGTLDFRGL